MDSSRTCCVAVFGLATASPRRHRPAATSPQWSITTRRYEARRWMDGRSLVTNEGARRTPMEIRRSAPSGVRPTTTRSSTGLWALAWNMTVSGATSSPSIEIGSLVRRCARSTAPYRCSSTVPPPPVAYGETVREASSVASDMVGTVLRGTDVHSRMSDTPLEARGRLGQHPNRGPDSRPQPGAGEPLHWRPGQTVARSIEANPDHERQRGAARMASPEET